MWWVRHHRAHHQYTDTDKDPYNAHRGFLFTHIGWLIGYNPSAWGKVDLSDLEKDPVVVWQERYYVIIALLISPGLPIAISHYGWDDWKGGLVYGAAVRLAISMHCTFFVNSLAHASWAGTQPYSDKHTARNVPLVALLAGGEGSHNFHHTFPSDYRNGMKWFEPDWSTHFILMCQRLGLASDLITTSPSEIEMARLIQIQQGHHFEKPNLPALPQLPVMDWNSFTAQVARGRCLVCINDIVHDITDFIYDHPGGRMVLQDAIGQDVTNTFYNGHHPHSPYAKTILEAMRIALIQGRGQDCSSLRQK